MNDQIEVFINSQAHTLAHGAVLSDAIAAVRIQPPFAAAVNLQFVPHAAYSRCALQDKDQIELIAPITGG